ncbi:hypothetical protein H6F88_26700 [Oculatella sp. FACHB-28]|uniref:hypothetical protein n=1 Tax=Oculatella sp. FACHB-28 TaxID=2692845 RepID=UPI001683993E|nr:hypothetical protein [Oculatella sp. FACHB-28]MBD2059542.1 hypothetical protein [Oculatella sp. FACHB-28]
MKSGVLIAFGAIATLSSTTPTLSSHHVIHFGSWSGQEDQQKLTSCDLPEPTSTPAPTDSNDEPSA